MGNVVSAGLGGEPGTTAPRQPGYGGSHRLRNPPPRRWREELGRCEVPDGYNTRPGHRAGRAESSGRLVLFPHGASGGLRVAEDSPGLGFC